MFPLRYGLYLCVPCGSHNKQRLFPQTELTDCALERRRNVFPVRYKLNSYIILKKYLGVEAGTNTSTMVLRVV
jgi:hypothetical protein